MQTASRARVGQSPLLAYGVRIVGLAVYFMFFRPALLPEGTTTQWCS